MFAPLLLSFVLLGASPISATPPHGSGRGPGHEAGRDAGCLEAPSFALRVRKVHTGRGDVLEPGTVIVREGRIAEVGTDLHIPDGIPVRDLPNHVLIPGLIDAAVSGEAADVTKSLSPEVLALDGLDFFEDRRRLLRGGVTTVCVSPGTALPETARVRLVSGRPAVVKVAGHGADPARRIVRRTCGVQVTLGETSKGPPPLYDPPSDASPDRPFEPVVAQLPQSRGGAILALRDLLDEAVRHRALVDAAREGREPPPPPSPELAALLPALRGEEPLRVRAQLPRDILPALELADRYGVRMVLEGARESAPIAGEIASRGVPVILEGSLRPGRLPPGDLEAPSAVGRRRDETARDLAASGVTIALRSPTDAETGHLLLEAEAAVRAGLDPATALRAVTLGAAEVLGVEDRVGSIERGKDADLVLLAGDPFTPDGRAEAVFVDGELVHHEGPTEVAEGTTIILARRVHDGKGGEHPAGIVLVKGGKVRYVGPGPLAASLGRPLAIVDASRATVIPGLIDGGSSAGLRVDMLGPAISPGSGSAGAGARPELRVADAVEPGDPDFETLLRAGFTTVLLSPDPVGPISGEVSAWKTGARSREDALLSPRAALVLRSDLRIDELRKAKDYRARREAFESERAKRARSGTPPERGSLKPPEKPPDHPPEKVAETLAGEPAQDQAEDLARDLAEDATETPAEQRAEKPTAEPPEKDDALEAFLPLLDRSIPAVVFAPSPEAMLPFARTLAKDFGIRVVAAPTGRADRIVAELKGLGAGLLLSVPLELIDEFETVHLPRAAASEGIRFAFRSGVAAGGAGLPAQVGLAVRAGWSSREALIAMTSAPAELFGIADRVGSIAEGRDADLVFLSDEPFAPTVRVLGVMTGGEMRFGAGDMVTREGIVNPAGGEDGR